MKFLLPIFLFYLLLAACGSENNGNEQEGATIPEKTEGVTPISVGLPAMPQPELDALRNTCTYIDVILYNRDYSMNLYEPASIKNLISLISAAPATTLGTCQPQGRLFFQSNGNVVLEADIYFQEGVCTYLKFLQKGKPVYANNLAEGGISLFRDYLNQNTSQLKNRIQQNQ